MLAVILADACWEHIITTSAITDADQQVRLANGRPETPDKVCTQPAIFLSPLCLSSIDTAHCAGYSLQHCNLY